MDSKIIFFAFIFSGPLFAMQNETGWNPLTYKTKCVNDIFRELKLNQEKARQFLAQVPASYANMRKNVAVDPDHFSRDFFERFSQQHVARLKEIIAVLGWPDFDEQSAFGAWYIAQQATEDPEFQEQALLHLDEILKDSIQSKKMYLRTQFAYLYDLVRIKKGKEQLYGTACDQEGYIKPIKGYKPHLLGHTLNLQMVNQRRAQMGLDTLENYKLELDTLFALARLNDAKVVSLSCQSPEHRSLPTQATDQDGPTTAIELRPDNESGVLCSPTLQQPLAPILLADNDLQPS